MRKDGCRRMGQLVDAAPADDHPVDQQDKSDEEPDRDHVVLLRFVIHEINSVLHSCLSVPQSFSGSVAQSLRVLTA